MTGPGVFVAIAIVILMAVIFAVQTEMNKKGSFTSCVGCGGYSGGASRRGDWVGGGGPYGLQLYDSPRYYPFYEGRNYTDGWDVNGRCAAYCSASEDGGCSVACR